MDLELLKKLLHNLLNTEVMIYDNDVRPLAAFEDTYCFQKALQPMFTANSLSYLLNSMNDTTFYELVDKLNVCLFFFRFDQKVFLIGPYVRTEYSDEKMQGILIKNKMPASYATSLRLYYTALPLLASCQILFFPNTPIEDSWDFRRNRENRRHTSRIPLITAGSISATMPKTAC